MKELLDKLSSYNIFNYLFPGVLFAIFVSNTTQFKLNVADNVLVLFVYYLYGLIISRFGSLVVEPIFKKLKFIKFSNYSDYIKASEKDPLLITLSEQNNMFRTLIAGIILLLITIGIDHLYLKYTNLKDYNNIVLLIILAFLFSWAYRKQTTYVMKRVKASTESTT